MCGIVGSFRPVGGEVCSNDILSVMRDKMVHRGPNGGGAWRSRDGKCVLGHRRLSIIDLSTTANQPMANQDGSVVLVFNGEIYNHAELRRELESLGKYQWATDHSDTEVLLHAYEEWGLDCVHRFHGMFAFLVYDARDPARPVFHAVRDRIGIKPICFHRTAKGEWLFASEIRALAAHPDVSVEMDTTAFWHYLTFIVTPAPLTLFKGIFKLPAAHSMTIDHHGRATCRRYWDGARPDRERTLTSNDISEEEAVAELTRLLKQSIKRRMVSDVPFGVLLSGGVDSSLNVALMSELMDRPVTTFTIGYEGKEDYNEFVHARTISKQYATDHHEVMINRKEMQTFLPKLVELQDEPIADNVCIPLYFLAKLVRDSGTTVVQVGEGADENFLGYWWCDRYRALAESTRHANQGAPSWWRRWLRPANGAPRFAAADEAEAFDRVAKGQELFWGGAACWWGKVRPQLTPRSEPFAGEIDCPVEGLLPESHRQLDSHGVVRHYLRELDGRLAQPDVLQRIPYMELQLRLPEHLLMRVDKLTMAHAIEARVPFLDHDVVEFAARLSPCFKLKDGVGKYIVKRAAEPYLPKEIIYRKKQGFGAPMEEWFKEGDFGPRCLELYQRSRFAKERFFDNDYLVGMLKSQMNGGGGHSFHLWTVLNAALWHEVWIDGRRDFF